MRLLHAVSLNALATVVVVMDVVQGFNILFGNDDGWASTHIRAAFDELDTAGYNVLLSCPAENKSGSASSSVGKTIPNRTEPCEYGSCPAGSGPTGFNTTNPRLNWVNGFPVDAIRYGIQTLSPQFFGGPGGKPDLVVSGPNIGPNGGIQVVFSGTVGAAVEASKQGIPAIAISGVTGVQASYTILESDPTNPSVIAARIYAELARRVVDALFIGQQLSSMSIASDQAPLSATDSSPLLPPHTILNINIPSIASCPSISDVQFILTRIYWNPLGMDVSTCGRTGQLPLERNVYTRKDGCWASVSVMDVRDKTDAGREEQGVVLERLGETLPLGCLPMSSWGGR